MRHDFGAPWQRLLLVGMTLSACLLAACSSGGDDGGGGGGGDNDRTLTGTVTNASTGNAVAGATVASSGRSTTTLADGTYTLTGLPSTGTITVTVTATDYNTSAVDITDVSQTVHNVALVPTSGSFDPTQPPAPPDFD